MKERRTVVLKTVIEKTVVSSLSPQGRKSKVLYGMGWMLVTCAILYITYNKLVL